MSRRLARQDRAFERIYQRHVGDVYRYALVVLRDPQDAEDVTRTTFFNAYQGFCAGERPHRPLNRLLAIAYELCRIRGGYVRLDEDALADPQSLREKLEDSLTCHQAKRAISRELDGRLSRKERRLLHRHLDSCPDCTIVAQDQQAQREALRALARFPVPTTLSSFFRSACVDLESRKLLAAAASE